MRVVSRLTVFIAGATALVLAGAVVIPDLIIAAAAVDCLLIAACLIENTGKSSLHVKVEREKINTCQLGREVDFIYRIENRSNSPVTVELWQTWPDSFDYEEKSNSLNIEVGPFEEVRTALTALPRERGHITLPAVEITVKKSLSFTNKIFSAAGDQQITVYPLLDKVKEYDKLRTSRSLGLIGIHRMRLLGEGREFEQLRDYLPDDEYRSINWKATARKKHPVTNVYQVERSQNVIFCIDCGRMMGNPVGSGTALDKAIDASIMLSHVVNSQGDKTGAALFSDHVESFVKPAKGATAANYIVRTLIEAKASGLFPSYESLVTHLRTYQKKRSMIFIFTDLNDPQLVSDMAKVLPLISRKHICVVVTLCDPELEIMADNDAKESRQLYRVLAARTLLNERKSRKIDLANSGVQVLESDADAITMDVINRYLEIKMRQLT